VRPRFGIRTRLRKMLDIKVEPFDPYLKDVALDSHTFTFFFATPQARDWYDPLKSYARLEYDWVLKNVNLQNQKIIDAGAHHGQYTVVFAVGAEGNSEIVAVDAVDSNCDIVRVNLCLNHAKARIERCAVSISNAPVSFTPVSNGHIVSEGGILRPAKRLPDIMPDATIVKLDIEGAEFDVLPDQIDEMRHVHTWIVEIHPYGGQNPEQLIDLLVQRDFKILWVNRDLNRVEPYPTGTVWHSHTTIFAVQ
jgi:FkbM family methyltransferase